MTHGPSEKGGSTTRSVAASGCESGIVAHLFERYQTACLGREDHVRMTPRHDGLPSCAQGNGMESLGRRVVDPRTADLAALKATSELRQQLRRGSPEWRRASREEEGLIARVLAGIRQRSTDLRFE